MEKEIDSLVSLWKECTIAMDFDSIVRSGTRSYLKAEAEGNVNMRMYSAMYVAQAYLSKSRYDSVYLWMSQIDMDIEESDNADLRMMLYNMEAIVALSMEMDYGSCFDYLNRALEIARSSGSLENQCSILNNFAGIYYSRKDTLGYSYAKEAYELSKRTGDMYNLPSSIVHMIRMCILKNDYNGAVEYIGELRELYEITHVAQYVYMENLLTADVMSRKGQCDDACMYYEAALNLSDSVTVLSRLEGFLNYGNCLLSLESWNKAVGVFEKGLHLSRERSALEYMGEFLLGLSEVYRLLGDEEMAYDYYQQYHVYEQQKSSSERKFNQLLLMFHSLRHQQEMALKDQALMEEQRRNLLIGSCSLVLLVILVCIGLMYRRKNSMYRRMVENHYKLSTALERAVSELKAQDKEKEDKNSDDLLYGRIEHLMKSEKVYRMRDLSLEKLSDILSTNRTYVSNTINIKSGKSFYNYINGYRIAEALTILSDTENDIPLKALCEDLGFNSMSVFYRAFQKETGVPPSRYREEIRKIKHSS